MVWRHTCFILCLILCIHVSQSGVFSSPSVPLGNNSCLHHNHYFGGTVEPLLIADTSLRTPTFSPNLVIFIFDLCNQDTSQNTHVQSKQHRRIHKKTVQKHFYDEMKILSSLKTRIYSKDFQMHQQSLDHSYCKRETSLTILKILVVRLLVSSPTQWNVWYFSILESSAVFDIMEHKINAQNRLLLLGILMRPGCG
jgi:hypothetical protein